jgi:hypothetical protein
VHPDTRLAAITHCHSLQSANGASPMDALIRRAVARVIEAPADDFDWSESLTTAEDFARILDPRVPGVQADLIFVTDHTNETTTRLDPDLVALADADPRLAIGAELQTVVEAPEGSGQWKDAPEVLMYGGPDKVATGNHRHYGINIAMLDDIRATCTPAGSHRVELHRVLAWCRRNGIAHALSHPLDGHGLDVATLLEAISASRFLETVNGGFVGPSHTRLERYRGVHDRLVSMDALERDADVSLRGVGAAAWSAAERRMDRAADTGAGFVASQADLEENVGARPALDADPAAVARWFTHTLAARRRFAGADDCGIDGGPRYAADGIVAWGGADAHMGRYDRVVVRYRPSSASVARNTTAGPSPAGARSAGFGIPEFVRDMAETPTMVLGAEQTFTIEGRGNSSWTRFGEVGALVAANARRNRATFRGLRRMARLAAIAPMEAVAELRRHDAQARRFGQNFDRTLDALGV